MSGRKRLVITTAAQRDIDDILLFTRQRWENDHRRRYSALLRRSIRLLVDYPERGHTGEDLPVGYRCLNVEAHAVFYRVTADRIVVDRGLRHNRNASEEVGE